MDPRSRALSAKPVDAPVDISDAAFPFMACGALTICGGTPARLFRISFSGELACEIAVPASFGTTLPEVLTAASEEFGAFPFSVEALVVMRVEKGHVSRNTLNGQTTADSPGLSRMVAQTKHFIDRARAGVTMADGLERARLMGFVPDPTTATARYEWRGVQWLTSPTKCRGLHKTCMSLKSGNRFRASRICEVNGLEPVAQMQMSATCARLPR